MKENPFDYRCIGEERTEELDVIPQSFLKRVYIRRKYVLKDQKDLPPIIEESPVRLIEGSIASPGLLTHIILSKYMDHLPLYRVEQIFKHRHGIELSRKTMSDWMDDVAHWFKPLYNLIREELKVSGYLQIDETPIRLNCFYVGHTQEENFLSLLMKPQKKQDGFLSKFKIFMQ